MSKKSCTDHRRLLLDSWGPLVKVKCVPEVRLNIAHESIVLILQRKDPNLILYTCRDMTNFIILFMYHENVKFLLHFIFYRLISVVEEVFLVFITHTLVCCLPRRFSIVTLSHLFIFFFGLFTFFTCHSIDQVNPSRPSDLFEGSRLLFLFTLYKSLDVRVIPKDLGIGVFSGSKDTRDSDHNPRYRNKVPLSRVRPRVCGDSGFVNLVPR